MNKNIRLMTMGLWLSSSLYLTGSTLVDEYNRFTTKNHILQALHAVLKDNKGYTDFQREQLMEYFDALGVYQEIPWFISGGDQATVESIKELYKKIDNASTQNNPYQAEKFTTACLDTLPNRGIKTRWTTILTCFQLAKQKAGL